ncbi:Tyrosine recombinase XerA [uncultured archaeon]|nr:Tyrosine recombinase XerA [uncultured archaeon]
MYEEFLKHQKLNGASANTIKNYTSILKAANEYKPLEQWTKEDVTNYILSLEKDYSKATIELRKTVFKTLFKWYGKPEIVNHLKIKAVKTPLNRNDILTVEDVNLMIETTESPMYKALIALLFESGGRINEVLPITVEEVKETDKGMIIPLHQSKTGEDYRPVLCIFSAQYIRNHITYSALDKKDRLFPVVDVSVWEMLKKIGKKSGITKPISAHKFRHAQAVDMLKRGYQDQITKKKLGWKDDSKMLARYSHVVDDDVINATLEMAGADIPRQPVANLKQAESLKIADASMQFQKLAAENEDLKERIDQLEKNADMFDEKMIQVLIEKRVNELMDKS